MSGLTKTIQTIDPSMVVLFGATGDLSANYLLPALYHLDAVGYLPDSLKIVCVGRRDFDEQSYLDFIVKKSGFLKKLKQSSARKHFLKHLVYYQGDFGNVESFAGLTKVLADLERPSHKCYSRLYYFATSPEFFSPIAKMLKNAGLLKSCEVHDRKIRVLIEKPFGFGLKSARELNKLLLGFFKESQIYRIDHYQGKETVQNLMVVRFANSIFEPLWNKDHIDHIEISVLEEEGVGTRGKFYDETGALRDMVQNHLLQMLALVAMDEPKELKTELIRDEKLKVLKHLKSFSKKDCKTLVVRGQYEGYAMEVNRPSTTETYVALKTFVDLPRWRGMPVYLRTGKALGKKVTEISIHFKEPLKCLFKHCASNIMTFRIQPDESVDLQTNHKVPGFGVDLTQKKLEFGYKKGFEKDLPPAYERLLLDFIQGDQRLFIRSDEIEAAWKFVDSVTDNWKDLPLHVYKKGSAGPVAAENLIEKDLREWHTK